MLEKIGLPSKPSMRGANWVPDAPQCQGCSCQFTFINRKHHCRRCGGLFCGRCTQQRMTLRGQGDQPVRICDPCKKLEEAARFEQRCGSKSRALKGTSKLLLKNEDEIIKQLLEADGDSPSSSAQKSQSDVCNQQKTKRDASSSNSQEEPLIPEDVTDTSRNVINLHDAAVNEAETSSPEEMRRQAVEEKKKYRILKGEGKSEEALVAFKRGKELEKLANTLEMKIRKSRRLASVQKTNYQDNVTDGKKAPSRSCKTQKDGFASELKELGWSDADFHDTNKKSATLSVEGELSNLLRETSQVSHVGRASSSIDKSQVIAHKKKALMLKKQGNLAEAKEELKRAKILEKQLEEQELLGADDESDDELSNLMRSLKDDKEGLTSVNSIYDTNINFDQFKGLGDDFSLDVNFDVTDDDMNDPEIASALKSFGWDDGDLQLEGDVPADHEKLDANLLSFEKEAVNKKQAGDKSEAMSAEDRDKLKAEVLSLKKEAVKLRDAGKKAEAMSVLKRAKIIEKKLENLQTKGQTLEPVSSGMYIKSLENKSREVAHVGDLKQPPKIKMVIQKELLGSKKKVLALQREGRAEEAEEELKKGKILELQLEELENTAKGKNYFVESNIKPAYSRQDPSSTVNYSVAIDEANVTDEDMNDPELLAALENIDGIEVLESTIKSVPSKTIGSKPKDNCGPSHVTSKQARMEIQRELLGIKRKAHALRRQGKFDEAEDELRKAKDLESQLAVPDVTLSSIPETSSGGSSPLVSAETKVLGTRRNVKHIPKNPHQEPSLELGMLEDINEAEVTDQDMNDPALLSVLEDLGWKGDTASTDTDMSSQLMHDANPSIIFTKHAKSKSAAKRELLNIKRKALALRREGNFDEAEEELKKAKNLENELAGAECARPPAREEKDKEQISHSKLTAGAINLVTEFSKNDSSDSLVSEALRNNHEIQKDLSNLKRRDAVILQDGNAKDTDEELRKGKDLANQMTGMKAVQTSEPPAISAIFPDTKVEAADNLQECDKHTFLHRDGIMNDGIVGIDASSTDRSGVREDLNPIGRNGDDSSIRVISTKPDNSRPLATKAVSTQAQIQKDLLTIKRKAHALRNQGKIKEAEDELTNCKELEDQLTEMEVAKSHNISQGSDGLNMQVPDDSINVFGDVMRSDQKVLLHTGIASGREVGNLGPQLPETVHHTFPTEALSLVENPNEEATFFFLDPAKAPTRVLPPNPHADLIDFGTNFEQKHKSYVEQKPAENVVLVPESDHSFSLVNLLTGDVIHKNSTSPGASSAVQVGALDSPRSSFVGLAVKSNVPISSKGQAGGHDMTDVQRLNMNPVERGVNEVHHTDQLPPGEANLNKVTDSLKDQVLACKRKAVALKREGKLAEAREELRQAKAMEKRLEEENQQASQDDSTNGLSSTSSRSATEEEDARKINLQSQKPLSGRDRFRMQQESLAHKRQAMRLRREGKMDEAEVETQLAKKLEAQIEEHDSHAPNSGKSMIKTEDDGLVEDLLDPQLMSSLKAIGWQEADMGVVASSKPEVKLEVKPVPRKETDMKTNVGIEKAQLQEQIKAEKLRALNLKHAGKQAEALEALRSAKRLEKRLASLPS